MLAKILLKALRVLQMHFINVYCDICCYWGWFNYGSMWSDLWDPSASLISDYRSLSPALCLNFVSRLS